VVQKSEIFCFIVGFKKFLNPIFHENYLFKHESNSIFEIIILKNIWIEWVFVCNSIFTGTQKTQILFENTYHHHHLVANKT